MPTIYTRELLDLREPLFTGIIFKLDAAGHVLTAATVANRNGFSPAAVAAALEVLTVEGVTTPGPETLRSRTPRWRLTDWGRDWARVAAEREARLVARAKGRAYHYADARDGAGHRPPEEHWCDWCAGHYGVPHDITSPDAQWGTHRVGELCRNRRRDQCACIDCATLRNERTTLTHRP